MSFNPNPDEPLSFDQWYAHLQILAREQGWDIGHESDKDIWREYFDDGDEPSRALQDDMDHA